MKKTVLLILTISCIVFAALAGASAPQKTAWILLPDTEMRAEPSYVADVVYVCTQNAEVTVIGEPVEVDGISWQKISFNNAKVGYVPQDHIYYTAQSVTEKIRVVKITPEKMGVLVPIYKTLDDVVAAGELSDGDKVVLLETKADYGDYSLVEYNGENFFVESKYLTDTLTLNQKIAVIISAAIIGIIVCIVTILLLSRKKNLNK